MNSWRHKYNHTWTRINYFARFFIHRINVILAFDGNKLGERNNCSIQMETKTHSLIIPYIFRLYYFKNFLLRHEQNTNAEMTSSFYLTTTPPIEATPIVKWYQLPIPYPKSYRLLHLTYILDTVLLSSIQ